MHNHSLVWLISLDQPINYKALHDLVKTGSKRASKSKTRNADAVSLHPSFSQVIKFRSVGVEKMSNTTDYYLFIYLFFLSELDIICN